MNLNDLTRREEQVLYLMVECCLTDKEIGRHLNVSFTAIQSRVRSIWRKLNVHSRTELCRLYYIGEKPCQPTFTFDGLPPRKSMAPAILPSGFLGRSSS